MKAKITKITRRQSKYGNWFYFIFFKGEDGKSYRTMTGEQYGNYKRWGNVVEEWRKGAAQLKNSGVEIWLKGLVIKKDRIIDADSLFEVERR